MKNPQKVFIPRDGELVMFSGFISHVEQKDSYNRICFKADTKERDSGLVGVTAFKSDKGPDYKALTDDAKGRFAVVLARKTVSENGYDNYTLQNIIFAPRPNGQ